MATARCNGGSLFSDSGKLETTADETVARRSPVEARRGSGSPKRSFGSISSRASGVEQNETRIMAWRMDRLRSDMELMGIGETKMSSSQATKTRVLFEVSDPQTATDVRRARSQVVGVRRAIKIDLGHN
ncbi:hypothetical protein JDV02_007045 [Purpureocillium takamizusanense]|uniref:Uncharacterized protein n=1 Tax=Purpureocillium takamizusanense TaxID=2060973 RepID=A0A9Q8QKR0_9HYPO|nr:uncharacterized protein JDV02_007045 [Purpureocillium takamizusanense]UNI21012.1 hypothetical protein JDV02_007045 [Purpureocillium takamizusanense]